MKDKPLKTCLKNQSVNQYYSRNFFAFLWHALFLALAKNFTDINTIIPSMIISAGGTSVHLGIQTAIMVGGASFMQIVFAGFLSRKTCKKGYLILGISLRIASLFGLGLLLYFSSRLIGDIVILFIFLIISVFSFSGSFANISYTDILGKSIDKNSRKKFFTLRQTTVSIGIFVSAIIVRRLVSMYSYPYNYSLLFVIASALLFTASIGFWLIKEKPTEFGDSILKNKSIIKAYIQIFREDRNIRYYLLLINSMGFGLTMVPFYVYLAKQNLGLDARTVGNFLLVQIAGMIISNYVWHIIVKKNSYRGIAKAYAIIASLVPLIALVLSGEIGSYTNSRLYVIVFFLAGFNSSAYQIVIPGVLLEISREHNRALYTALSGAGSLTTIIFPLLGGWLIKWLGFSVVFFIGIAMTELIFLAIKNIVCEVNRD